MLKPNLQALQEEERSHLPHTCYSKTTKLVQSWTNGHTTISLKPLISRSQFQDNSCRRNGFKGLWREAIALSD